MPDMHRNGRLRWVPVVLVEGDVALVEFKVGTPHPVTVIDVDDVAVTFYPRQRPARVERPNEEQGSFEVAGRRFRRFEARVIGIKGLPAPEPGVYWIVSSETAREGRHTRNDLVAPHIFVKKKNDETGVNEVVACKALIHFGTPTEELKDAGIRRPAKRRRGNGGDRAAGDRSAGRPGRRSEIPVVAAVEPDRDDKHVDDPQFDDRYFDDPGPTAEELAAQEAALDAQYDIWAEEDAQTAWAAQYRAAHANHQS